MNWFAHEFDSISYPCDVECGFESHEIVGLFFENSMLCLKAGFARGRSILILRSHFQGIEGVYLGLTCVVL